VKVVLPPEECALELYEHLNKGIIEGKVFLQHKDAEWAQTFVNLMNLTLRAKRDAAK
jgi:hypothetical protein